MTLEPASYLNARLAVIAKILRGEPADPKLLRRLGYHRGRAR